VPNVSELKQETLSTFIDGDHDLFAHYVDKVEATKAMIFGSPVVALCGKVWIPSRDPDKFPVCPECKSIHEKLFNNENNK
jgi:hypothetical protein